MFERYTEKGRRVIFYGRYEASKHCSSYIETQHLLAAVLREEPQVVKPFLPEGTSPETLLAELATIYKNAPVASSTSVDLPLSMESKRVLAYAAEASESLGDRHIGTEHLLLGLLRDDHTAQRFLAKHGIQREHVWQQLDRRHPNAPQAPMDGASREDLHSLIDSLPDGAMDSAAGMLRNIQVWPPPQQQVPPRIAELQQRMQDLIRERRTPGIGGGGGTSSFASGPAGSVQSGHFSFSRSEEGTLVFETHRFHQGHEVTLVERLRSSDDGKNLSYSVDISGPKQQRHVDILFDVS